MAEEPSEAEELVEKEKDETVCDIMACETLDKATLSSAVELNSDEDGLWANMSSEDYDIGVVQRYGAPPPRRRYNHPPSIPCSSGPTQAW